MNYAAALLTILTLSSPIIAQLDAQWRGIIPLIATRDDVERAARGLAVNNSQIVDGDRRISVKYALERCIGHGWNVSPDTVIEYTVDFLPGISSQQLMAKVQQLARTPDDTANQHYTDRRRGLQFEVSSSEVLTSVRHFPANTAPRCKGFPPFDPLSSIYRPYDTYLLKHHGDDVSFAAGLLSQLAHVPKMRGYIIYYLARGRPTSEARKLGQGLQKLVKETGAQIATRTTVIFGGFRETGEVALFLLNANDHPPVPTPKYGGFSSGRVSKKAKRRHS